jgi:hypothetical protein
MRIQALQILCVPFSSKHPLSEFISTNSGMTLYAQLLDHQNRTWRKVNQPVGGAADNPVIQG